MIPEIIQKLDAKYPCVESLEAHGVRVYHDESIDMLGFTDFQAGINIYRDKNIFKERKINLGKCLDVQRISMRVFMSTRPDFWNKMYILGAM